MQRCKYANCLKSPNGFSIYCAQHIKQIKQTGLKLLMRIHDKIKDRWDQLLEKLEFKSRNTMKEDGPGVVKVGVFIDSVKACGGPKLSIKQIELLIEAFSCKSDKNPQDM